MSKQTPKQKYQAHVRASKQPAFRFLPWEKLPAHIKAKFGEKEKAPAEETQAPPPGDAPTGRTVDEMTKPELLELAREMNLSGYSDLNKADLLAFIKEHTK